MPSGLASIDAAEGSADEQAHSRPGRTPSGTRAPRRRARRCGSSARATAPASRPRPAGRRSSSVRGLRDGKCAASRSGAHAYAAFPPRPTWHNFNDSDSDQWLRQPECAAIHPPSAALARVIERIAESQTHMFYLIISHFVCISYRLEQQAFAPSDFRGTAAPGSAVVLYPAPWAVQDCRGGRVTARRYNFVRNPKKQQ